MHFTATDVYDYYKPDKCARRVALVARGEPAQETATPFDKLLKKLGLRHEATHLATLSDVVDLSPLKDDPLERERLTLEAIHSAAPAIYQPRFRQNLLLDNAPCELVGEPDFLIRDPARDGYVIRDSKLARNIFSTRHEGIPLQLQIYGLLYERAVGKPALELQVHTGTGAILPVPYEGEAAVLAALREHIRMRAADPAEYEPVGWSKCAGCGFQDRCWSEAEATQDVSLLTSVPQKRARDLHDRGIKSIGDIAPAIDDPAHHDYFWQNKKKPRHREFVGALLKSAQSYLSNTAIRGEDALPIPATPNFAMFDLEGLPPYIDDLDRIYLWGLKVFGDRPSPYHAAQAGFGPDGDREGWLAFLQLADRLFTEYGPDLPFVHWSSYEKTKIETYIERFGDPSGIAAHVLANLVNLFTALKASVVLPLPSYSLKVVDEYVGFRRKLEDANGAWSIARYIEATETDEPAARDAIVGQILAYNEEDLDATWAVMEWTRNSTQPRRVEP